MKRLLDTTGTEAVVKTTNGATTYTSLCYARELKEFTPLPNGFNRELADYITEYIEAREGRLWEQGHWRAVITTNKGWGGDFENIEAVAPWMVYTDTEGEHACGTSMCYAGWVGELTGADHVIDAEVIRAVSKKQGLPGISEDSFISDLVDAFTTEVLVRLDDPLFQAYLRFASKGFPDDYDAMPYLATRGFSPQTHAAVEISHYAAVCLGIACFEAGYVTVDSRGLFGAGNNWASVKAIIDTYTEYGPDYEKDSELEPAQRLRLEIMQRGDERGRYYWKAIGDHHDAVADQIVAELAETKVGYDYHVGQLPSWATRELADA